MRDFYLFFNHHTATQVGEYSTDDSGYMSKLEESHRMDSRSERYSDLTDGGIVVCTCTNILIVYMGRSSG